MTLPCHKRQLLVGSSIAAALAAGLLVPSPAWAQAGWYVTPSVSLSEVYDDNLFSTPSNPPAGTQSKQGDFIFRGTPGVIAGYESKPFTLLGNYAIRGEVYAEDSDLDTIPAMQLATLETRYLPNPLLTLSFLGGYLESEQASQLNSPTVETVTGTPATALQGQRARSSLYNLNPGVSYQIDQLTTVRDGYSFLHTQQVGATSGDTHSVIASLDRKITEQDTGDLAYTFRRFSFTQPAPPPPPPQPDDVTNSHIVTVGWTRELTSLTRVILRGGPRFTGGSVAPEAFGSISHKLARGVLEFSYQRTQTTAIGEAGPLNTESFTGTASYEPLQEMLATVALFLYRDSQEGTGTTNTDVYGTSLTVRYRISQWLSVLGSYEFSYQNGLLGTATTGVASSGNDIYHNVVLIGLEASQPYRSQ